MKTASQKPFRTGNLGFTMIEMIGVLAVMAILAAVVTPNALHTLDRAAVRAEQDTLHNLGEQTKLFFNVNGWIPGMNILTWDGDLANFASLAPADITTNKRQMIRQFVVDPNPAARFQRAMFISSMRPGVALGPAATTAAFANVWDWNTNDLTASPPPAGWNQWNATNVEFLVIERVSLQGCFMNVVLTNNGTATVSYDIVPAVGTPGGRINIPAPPTPGSTVTLQLTPKTRLDLYKNTTDLVPNYVYFASTGYKVIDFNDTHFWTPQ